MLAPSLATVPGSPGSSLLLRQVQLLELYYEKLRPCSGTRLCLSPAPKPRAEHPGTPGRVSTTALFATFPECSCVLFLLFILSSLFFLLSLSPCLPQNWGLNLGPHPILSRCCTTELNPRFLQFLLKHVGVFLTAGVLSGLLRHQSLLFFEAFLHTLLFLQSIHPLYHTLAPGIPARPVLCQLQSQTGLKAVSTN